MLGPAEAILLTYLQGFGPSTAYALARRISRSPARCLTVSTPALYPIVKRLAKRGLIRGEVVPRELQSAKTLWSLTTKGERALLDWVATPASIDQYRSGRPLFEIKCVTCGLLEPERRLVFLAGQLGLLEEYRESLSTYIERYASYPAMAEVFATTLAQLDLDLALLRRLDPNVAETKGALE